jgi:hypothetical protein
MDWIDFEGESPFMFIFAVQGGSHLSSHLANEAKIDHAAAELKRQIDITVRRMKMALQKPPGKLFPDAQGS